MERAREVTFHQSANRPNMLLGGDRELVLMSALFAAVLIFTLAQVMGGDCGSGLLGNRLGCAEAISKG